jgi:hypothetical protein
MAAGAPDPEPAATTRDRLAIWKAITGHVIALTLAFGFFGVAFIALLGYVQITDPTTAGFVGTVLGYAVASLSKPLAWYFEQVMMPARDRREP